MVVVRFLVLVVCLLWFICLGCFVCDLVVLLWSLLIQPEFGCELLRAETLDCLFSLVFV